MKAASVVLMLMLTGQHLHAQSHSPRTYTRSVPASRISAPKPIFSFFGVSPETQVASASINGIDCLVNATGKTRCSNPNDSGVVIGDALIHTLSMHFNDGKLYGVFGTLSSNRYSELISAFTAKYGSATEARAETWQSKAGAVFENPVSTWHFRGGDLVVKAMGTSRDDTEFIFFHPGNAPKTPPTPVNF